jgi:hypothetical protein
LSYVLNIGVVGEGTKVAQVVGLIRAHLPRKLEAAKLGTVIVIELSAWVTDRKTGATILADVTAPEDVSQRIMGLFLDCIQEELGCAGIPITELGEPVRIPAQDIAAALLRHVETGMFDKDLWNSSPPPSPPETHIVAVT